MSDKVECEHCRRSVEILKVAGVWRYRKHTRGEWSNDLCPAGGAIYVAPVRRPSRHGNGARGTAPCGHPGTYVTASMVLCEFEWCDGRPLGAAPKPPLYECQHPIKVTWLGTTSCKSCGKVFRR